MNIVVVVVVVDDREDDRIAIGNADCAEIKMRH